MDLNAGADLLAAGIPDTTMIDSFDDFAAQDASLDPAAFAAIAGEGPKTDSGTAAALNGDTPSSTLSLPGLSSDSRSMTALLWPSTLPKNWQQRNTQLHKIMQQA